MATLTNTTPASRFHNLSNAALADELGRIDSIMKAAGGRAETPQRRIQIARTSGSSGRCIRRQRNGANLRSSGRQGGSPISGPDLCAL
jgi:hypothetical protein